MRVGQQIQSLGFTLAGLLCLVLVVLLTIEVHWSWYRCGWSGAITHCT
jgi:hypothetical protein